ncbi:glycosyltransferase [Streptacidiphilus fuscans]|uniref:Glycosyltransferase family 2 protein n=1 Tax=Streptacidiphilus fuscans TaxID=2789292 RepID=A0A931FBU9_9ACTN|nr:glycosyltransferase family A protein [Streptacidiphilus fuscans]MBF9067818.1 glycosyltransferase family 2 protein [Streptacidiphilus fuscans]
MTTPLVTVITPVHDTRAYLRPWFDSLRQQTLDPGELEVLAVDDASTDGSREELHRLAAAWPEVVTVVPLEQRGGPGRARNEGLGRARGRFLFFLDSDDRLGPEALRRMTLTAGRCGSDVVVGRVAGENGRWVPEFACRETDDDVRFPGGDLAWTLTPSKLFRTELVRHHGMRFREDLPAYSDGPFVLEAFFRARRISVLADYDYYHLVAREDRSNITYRSRAADRLRGIAAGIEVTVRFAAPGAIRDEVNDRHLRGDLVNLFRADFLALARAEQETLVAAAGELVRAHLTDPIRARCGEAQRLRLHCLQHGLVDELTDLVRHETETGGLPEPVSARVSWTPEGLRVRTSRPLPQLTSAPVTWVRGQGQDGQGRDARGRGKPGRAGDETARVATDDETVIPLASLLPHQRVALRVESSLAGREVTAALTPEAGLGQRRVWHGGRLYRVTPVPGPRGELVVWVARIRAGRVLKLRLRQLSRRHRTPVRA